MKMMKKNIAIVIFVLSCGFCFSQQNKPTTAAPLKTEVKIAPAQSNGAMAEMKFEIEQHDFGTIPEGPEAKFDFEFTNIGKEPLVLSDVHASCGCTTPVWPKEPIAPGAKSKITAVYNTKGRGGNFSKSIIIKSNSKNGDKILIIKGVVESANKNNAPAKAPNIINEMPTKN